MATVFPPGIQLESVVVHAELDDQDRPDVCAALLRLPPPLGVTGPSEVRRSSGCLERRRRAGLTPFSFLLGADEADLM